MSLPLPAIDRVFLRLGATYGREFFNLYQGVEINAVKAAWAHELSGYSSSLKAIAWALENLPEYAPNAIRFRQLCRQEPAAVLPALPEPPADPERVAAELAKLGSICQTRGPDAGPVDHKAWAKKIMSRIEMGQKVGAYAQRCAREALGLPQPAPKYRLHLDAQGRVARDADIEDRQPLAA